MPNNPHREYWQNRRDAYFHTSLHFSLVRVAILAFLLPLAVVIVFQTHHVWYGVPAVIIAIALSYFFGKWSFYYYLKYMNCREWLPRRTHKGTDKPPQWRSTWRLYFGALCSKRRREKIKDKNGKIIPRLEISSGYILREWIIIGSLFLGSPLVFYLLSLALKALN